MSKRHICIGIAVLALCLVLLGVKNGEPAEVQAKGGKVCIECVGFGN